MSLKQLIKKEIKRKFPAVYKSKNDKISNIYQWINKRSFWPILIVYILFIIIITLYSKLIDFEFLKILDIEFDDNIKIFTTGIITLVSMNLFVTNLLFTHLKDERDDIQSIIDRKVNFKFITYLGFTLIICVLCLYFFSPNLIYNNTKSNILIFIFSSFIGYIFLLVNLYNTVFNFIHKTKRSEIIKTELNLEFRKAFYCDYLQKRFKEEYVNLMEKKTNFLPYPIWQEIPGLKAYTYKSSQNFYFADVSISQLSKLSGNKQNSEIYYHQLHLGREYLKNEDLKLFSLISNKNFKYKKIYTFSTKNSLSTFYSQENLDRLLRKINDNTLTNRYNDLSSNLKNLEEIYTEYIELEDEI